MSARETLKPKPFTPLSPGGVLQRKCACGHHTVAGGSCSACDKKNDVLQHPASNQSTQSRFGQDFSTVPIHAGANTPARESGGPLDNDPSSEPVKPLFSSTPGSSTLPYRESIELADCVRIMGEKNMDYCLEAVSRETSRRICSGSGIRTPLADMSTFQSPGLSGWWGAKFGCFRDSCTRKHNGWDIHAPVGTPIYAAVTGSVTHKTNPTGYGDYTILKSATDPTRGYLYGHLSAREPAGFYCVGNTIGKTGATGNASPARPHLHFELQVNGKAVDPGNEFTEPTNVIEQTGTSATVIDKNLWAACSPCAM